MVSRNFVPPALPYILCPFKVRVSLSAFSTQLKSPPIIVFRWVPMLELARASIWADRILGIALRYIDIISITLSSILHWTLRHLLSINTSAVSGRRATLGEESRTATPTPLAESDGVAGACTMCHPIALA
eukprot:scaffold194603_cov50-Tisochrysis_lutea.AAC.1